MFELEGILFFQNVFLWFFYVVPRITVSVKNALSLTALKTPTIDLASHRITSDALFLFLFLIRN